MTKNIFMSYSRREVGFVDDLVRNLEEKGYETWLDYRSLVPGKPWEEQIYQGIMNSNVILLVVSKSSIASVNVEYEWRRVLQEKNKRVILLIFEAVDLPKELEKFEWVDFRGNYQNALVELDRQLNMPEQEEHPAPQTGFKVPAVVWWAFILSVVVSIFSLPSLWTLFIPFFLIPLPFRILNRNFSYLLVQASLIILPFALYLTGFFSLTEMPGRIVDALMYISIPFVVALILILRSAGMQRWGRPESVSPQSPQHKNMRIDFPDPKPVPFFIDHAIQDKKIAATMRKIFTAEGHAEAPSAGSALAVFTLISRFKDDSAVDCDNQVVYPVIIQSNDRLSKQLSRLQWIDFRTGISRLDIVAKLLPEPAKLLRALCIRPMGNQVVLPAAILALSYFIAFLAVVCAGSWLPYLLEYFGEFLTDPDFQLVFIELAFTVILFGVIAYFMGKNLIERRGLFASLTGLVVGMLLLGSILLWQVGLDNRVFEILNTTVEARGYSAYFPRQIYSYGNLVMVVYLLFKRKDLMYWFPARK